MIGMKSRCPHRSTSAEHRSQPSCPKCPAQHRGGSGQWTGQWEGPYLLGGCVFNGVGVVVIVNDVQVLHGISREGAAELHVQRGFSGPFGVDREVGWFPVFHAWKDRL